MFVTEDRRYYTLNDPFFPILFEREKKQLLIHCSSSLLTYPSTVSINIDIITGDDKENEIRTNFVFSESDDFVTVSNIRNIPKTIKIKIKKPKYIDFELNRVGIKNICMTCYVSSSLQLLYSLPMFEKLLSDRLSKGGGVSAELLRVFTNLSTSASSISVKCLISSLGGNVSRKLYQQNDAHEFIVELLDKIDKELGQEFVKEREKLMCVVQTRVIENKSLGLRSEVDEVMNEIQVNVCDSSDLMSALRALTEEEVLTGENKWDSGTPHGKVDAVSYFRFKKLPAVLLIYLCRVYFNKRTCSLGVIKGSFNCPDTLALKEFSLNNEGEASYVMSGVIAHAGTPESGHYISYIRDIERDRWYCYDDDHVASVQHSDVKSLFEEHRGLSSLTDVFSSSFSAYIVSYIRKDFIGNFRTSVYKVYIWDQPDIIDLNFLLPKNLVTFNDKRSFFSFFEKPSNVFYCNTDFSNFTRVKHNNTLVSERLLKGVFYIIFNFTISSPIFVDTKISNISPVLSLKLLKELSSYTVTYNHRRIDCYSNIPPGSVVQVF